MTQLRKTDQREKRHRRIKRRIIGNNSRPRLSIFRSLQHLYLQLVDDRCHKSLLGLSDLNLPEAMKIKKPVEKASALGALLAAKARASGVTKIVFDRSGYRYHGRVKALAEAARKGGLSF